MNRLTYAKSVLAVSSLEIHSHCAGYPCLGFVRWTVGLMPAKDTSFADSSFVRRPRRRGKLSPATADDEIPRAVTTMRCSSGMLAENLAFRWRTLARALDTGRGQVKACCQETFPVFDA
jgi:hypothetical protein